MIARRIQNVGEVKRPMIPVITPDIPRPVSQESAPSVIAKIENGIPNIKMLRIPNIRESTPRVFGCSWLIAIKKRKSGDMFS